MGRTLQWLKNKIVVLVLALLAALMMSLFIPVLEPFRTSFLDYFNMIWWAILIGLLAGGMIEHFVPDDLVSHLLARPRKRTVIYSALLGFLLSACSHGILALGMELHKKGAATSSVIAFLMASPWANLPLTIMLFGFFGTGAIYIVLAALAVGITTGFIYQLLERMGWVERQPKSPDELEDYSVRSDLRKHYKDYHLSGKQLKQDAAAVWGGMVSLGGMVLWWILLGMTVASLIGAYVPQDFMRDWLGPTPLGLLLTLAVATVIEVCSEGSAPMAFEIYRQTGALGNSFVFLMAGVATDYTEIGLLWSNVGRKAALWLPVITVPQVVLLGWLANVWF